MKRSNKNVKLKKSLKGQKVHQIKRLIENSTSNGNKPNNRIKVWYKNASALLVNNFRLKNSWKIISANRSG